MSQNGEPVMTPSVVIRVKQGDDGQRRLFTQPENLGVAERVASIAAGALIIYWLGRRLLAMIGMVALAGFLLYRGIGGYCPITASLTRDRSRSFAPGVPDEMAEMAPLPDESALERELRRERQRDKIDERSWESFPASDPPAYS